MSAKISIHQNFNRVCEKNRQSLFCFLIRTRSCRKSVSSASCCLRVKLYCEIISSFVFAVIVIYTTFSLVSPLATVSVREVISCISQNTSLSFCFQFLRNIYFSCVLYSLLFGFWCGSRGKCGIFSCFRCKLGRFLFNTVLNFGGFVLLYIISLCFNLIR